MVSSYIQREGSDYLENVEGLKLYVPTPVNEHLHHKLQVVRVTDVETHRREVMTVEQQLTQQLGWVIREKFGY